MPPRTHLLTTSSHMNNIMPNVMLDAFGLIPVIEMPWSGGATHHPRTSVIKFAIVKDLEQFLSFFCFVSDVQLHGNYSEMFMYNTVKNNEPSKCQQMGIQYTKITKLY